MRTLGLRATVVASALTLAVLITQALAQGPADTRGKVTAKPKFGPEINDIFFPDAREKLGPGSPPGGALVGKTGKAPSGGPSIPPPMTPDVPAPSGGDAPAGAWAAMIGAEAIENEIKTQVTAVAGETRAAGPFKATGYKKARLQFTMLTVMFGVIAQYDGDVRWKKDAAGLRDELAKAAAACKTGDQYQSVKIQAESVADMVRGSQIDVPAGKGTPAWSTIADFKEIMKRMDQAERERAKPALGTKDEFKANKELIMHEAQILAVLADIIMDKGYDAAPNDDYQGWAKQMKNAAVELVDACKQDLHEKAVSMMAVITKSCAQCHEGYR